VVTDSSGVPAEGIRREDFTVFEDGAPREVRYLWREDQAFLVKIEVQQRLVTDLTHSIEELRAGALKLQAWLGSSQPERPPAP
jgi:hypothetical protein